MMTPDVSRPAGFGNLSAAMASAMQWRLLLLWLLWLELPTAVFTLPLWRLLAGLLDHSAHASEWAQRFDPLMVGDTLAALSQQTGWLSGVGLASFMLALLLIPFLNGMAVSAGRSRHQLGFIALMHGGLADYGRLLRLSLWALLPYLLVAEVAHIAHAAAANYASRAVLHTQADLAALMAKGVALMALVLAQTWLDSARAAFIIDADLRSAWRALGRGLVQLLRQPWRSLAFYLTVSLLGLAVAGLLAVARIHLTMASPAGFLWAPLVGWLMVLTLGWMRIARLFALASIAASRESVVN